MQRGHARFVAPAAMSADTYCVDSMHTVAPNSQRAFKGASLGLASWQTADGRPLLEEDDPVLTRHTARARGEESDYIGLAPTHLLDHRWRRSRWGLNLEAVGGDLHPDASRARSPQSVQSGATLSICGDSGDALFKRLW